MIPRIPRRLLVQIELTPEKLLGNMRACAPFGGGYSQIEKCATHHLTKTTLIKFAEDLKGNYKFQFLKFTRETGLKSGSEMITEKGFDARLSKISR